ncbi:NUDIX domain-containing protein [Paenibacillus nanensis]|uniref:NUDIX domain-containing protein n=1 Tax=Paenibacillus nanensis TaxID=393251 RepID=A0A3A1VIC0_9BACL|nr:NUDIX domain-containing protein [Paenibacillus nanensis]RIX60247.1 NUDIX domain-containing protein [Paenibacillus nanensis]
MSNEERFDIYDEDMRPLGTATRSETHAKGYWHRSFHCWVIRAEDGRRYVWFQMRQLIKDTNPGRFDITVAGHLSAGETLPDAVRELEEEIGISAEFDELIPLGQVREDLSGAVKGQPFIDREVSDVFAFVSEAPMTQLRLQPEEVAGVYEAEIEELLAIFEGRRSELVVQGVELAEEPGSGALQPSCRSIRADQFVPRDNAYYVDVMKKLLALKLE